MMGGADKRWQLLLVADNGRIIPFRRIRGIAIGLVFILVLLVAVCLLLGWQLTAERLRHHQTTAQLSAARQTAAQYKRDLELLSADLVLNEARMAKAGLPVPDREPPPLPETTETVALPAPPAAENTGAVSEPSDHAAMDEASAGESDAASTDGDVDASQPAAESQAASVAPPPPVETPPLPQAPLAVLAPQVRYDDGRKLLVARFRIENLNDDAKRAEGRCVVVLNTDGGGDQAFSLPQVVLVDGKPDGAAGKPFSIRHFLDVEIMRAAPADPSVFRKAVIHVFDNAGSPVLETILPLDLPAPPPPQPVQAPLPSPSVNRVEVETQAAAAAVSDFSLDVEADRRLTAKLRVKNVKSGPGALSGKCVIVLKGRDIDPDGWVTLPDVPLTAGRPDGSRGRTFRIVRFIVLTLRADAPADPSVFDTATVFVFDDDGNPLLSHDFPVDLPAPPSPRAARTVSTAKNEVRTSADAAAAEAGTAPAADVSVDAPAAAGDTSPSTGDLGESKKREDSRARY